MAHDHPSQSEETAPNEVRPIGRPSRQRMEAIDRQILETAADMFMRHGPAIAMRAIVEATGLSSKTVYARFSSKAELLPAAIRHLLQSASPCTIEPPRAGDMRSPLRDFLVHTAQNAYNPGAMALRRLLSAEVDFARQLQPDIAKVISQSFAEPIAVFFTEAKAAGYVRDIDVNQLARTITLLILAEPTSRINTGMPVPPRAELEAWADFLVDVILSGVGITGNALD